MPGGPEERLEHEGEGRQAGAPEEESTALRKKTGEGEHGGGLRHRRGRDESPQERDHEVRGCVAEEVREGSPDGRPGSDLRASGRLMPNKCTHLGMKDGVVFELSRIQRLVADLAYLRWRLTQYLWRAG